MILGHDTHGGAPMNPISLSTIPNFHRTTIEDRNALLFELNVIYRRYDYITYFHKLKLFPTTLKGESLIWFMGLGDGTINSWDEMKNSFLENYQEYCKS